MGLKVYLPLALITFVAATTGADLIARTSIGGEALGVAVREHLYDAAVGFLGTAFLLAPFVAVAFLCSRAQEQARFRSVALVFVVAMLTLSYFYFGGYQDAQFALLNKKWTAASLSIGMLPFLIGIPVVIVVAGAVALVAKFDRSSSGEGEA